MKLYEYRVAFHLEDENIRDFPPLISDATTDDDLDKSIIEHIEDWALDDYLCSYDLDPIEVTITVDRSDQWHDPIVIIIPTDDRDPSDMPPLRRLRTEITSG